jgi:type VI protein secretion system component Hcp
MATDVYIKFGTTKETIGPRNTPRPKIEGDSTDELHYWWCEVRNCGFDLEAKDPEPAPESGGGGKEEDKEKSKAKFKNVTLKKRVDWASTQLFLRCCDQAMALSKSKEEQEQGWLDIVTIEVCRPGPGDKIPFVIVEYHGVRFIHYSVEMSGPEPSESITFEFQKLSVQHTRVDPFTGNVAAKDAKTRTGLLSNSGTGQGAAAQEDAASSAASPPPAPAGGGGTGGPGASANPASPAPASANGDGPNFPGYGQAVNFEA